MVEAMDLPSERGFNSRCTHMTHWWWQEGYPANSVLVIVLSYLGRHIQALNNGVSNGKFTRSDIM